jgi:hypothetical protein
MAQSPDSIQRDANRVPIQSNEAFLVSKTRTFDGSAGNGAQGASDLFTVTGDVLVTVFAVCSEDLVGAGTIEAGISGNTAAILAQIANATNLDAGEVWSDSGPATVEALPGAKILSGADIIETIGTADITDGTITYYCLFRPLSEDATVTAAS